MGLSLSLGSVSTKLPLRWRILFSRPGCRGGCDKWVCGPVTTVFFFSFSAGGWLLTRCPLRKTAMNKWSRQGKIYTKYSCLKACAQPTTSSSPRKDRSWLIDRLDGWMGKRIGERKEGSIYIYLGSSPPTRGECGRPKTKRRVRSTQEGQGRAGQGGGAIRSGARHSISDATKMTKNFFASPTFS